MRMKSLRFPDDLAAAVDKLAEVTHSNFHRTALDLIAEGVSQRRDLLNGPTPEQKAVLNDLVREAQELGIY